MMNKCSDCNCGSGGNNNHKKSFWTFCNIKTIVALAAIIFWLVKEITA